MTSIILNALTYILNYSSFENAVEFSVMNIVYIHKWIFGPLVRQSL